LPLGPPLFFGPSNGRFQAGARTIPAPISRVTQRVQGPHGGDFTDKHGTPPQFPDYCETSSTIAIKSTEFEIPPYTRK
jgi:hypothetical protein